jgi:hypothetical protein
MTPAIILPILILVFVAAVIIGYLFTGPRR